MNSSLPTFSREKMALLASTFLGDSSERLLDALMIVQEAYEKPVDPTNPHSPTIAVYLTNRVIKDLISPSGDSIFTTLFNILYSPPAQSPPTAPTQQSPPTVPPTQSPPTAPRPSTSYKVVDGSMHVFFNQPGQSEPNATQDDDILTKLLRYSSSLSPEEQGTFTMEDALNAINRGGASQAPVGSSPSSPSPVQSSLNNLDNILENVMKQFLSPKEEEVEEEDTSSDEQTDTSSEEESDDDEDTKIISVNCPKGCKKVVITFE